MSVESDETAEGREFSISPGEAPQPYCPACSEVITTSLRKHRCRELSVAFTTSRGSCPFCKETIEGPATFPASAFGLLLGEIKEVKIRQDVLTVRLTSLEKEHISEFFRLNKKLDKLLEEIVSSWRADVVATSPASPPSEREPEPLTEAEAPLTFPISAREYLGKKPARWQSARPDFLKGIVVLDSEGRGELVLVEDSTVPGGLFYALPRVDHFMMKQEFYTFYERYYECHNPSAGEVWIVEPAVVVKVDGGWQLREKGVLEVR